MQKEILIAITFGSLLGLGGAFLIWKTNNPTTSPSPSLTTILTPSTNPDSTPTPAPDAKKFFDVSSIADISATNNQNITISGTAPINSWVVISTNQNDTIIPIVQNNEFSKQITLHGGINQLSITNIQDTQNPKTLLKTIIYSSSATTNNSVFLGSITDISEGNLQIKNSNGQIQQIAINSDTSYVNTTADSNKTIEFQDLAIGDFIAAIGNTTKELLTAQRIIVSTSLKQPNYEILTGKIKSLSKSTLITDTNQSLTINAQTTTIPTKLPTQSTALNKYFIAVTQDDTAKLPALRTLYISM